MKNRDFPRRKKTILREKKCGSPLIAGDQSQLAEKKKNSYLKNGGGKSFWADKKLYVQDFPLINKGILAN